MRYGYGKMTRAQKTFLNGLRAERLKNMKEAVKLHKEGLTGEETAVKMGLSVATIYKYWRDAGVSKPRLSAPSRRPPVDKSVKPKIRKCLRCRVEIKAYHKGEWFCENCRDFARKTGADMSLTV